MCEPEKRTGRLGSLSATGGKDSACTEKRERKSSTFQPPTQARRRARLRLAEGKGSVFAPHARLSLALPPLWGRQARLGRRRASLGREPGGGRAAPEAHSTCAGYTLVGGLQREDAGTFLQLHLAAQAQLGDDLQRLVAQAAHPVLLVETHVCLPLRRLLLNVWGRCLCSCFPPPPLVLN